MVVALVGADVACLVTGVEVKVKFSLTTSIRWYWERWREASPVDDTVTWGFVDPNKVKRDLWWIVFHRWKK